MTPVQKQPRVPNAAFGGFFSAAGTPKQHFFHHRSDLRNAGAIGR